MEGYAKFASFIAADHGMSIYRRFSTLSANNLLHLQAELVHLEAQLRDIITEDKTSGDAEKQKFPYSVWHLKRSAEDPSIGHPTQWSKVVEIRQKLKQYCQQCFQILLLDIYIC